MILKDNCLPSHFLFWFLFCLFIRTWVDCKYIPTHRLIMNGNPYSVRICATQKSCGETLRVLLDSRNASLLANEQTLDPSAWVRPTWRRISPELFLRINVIYLDKKLLSARPDCRRHTSNIQCVQNYLIKTFS